MDSTDTNFSREEFLSLYLSISASAFTPINSGTFAKLRIICKCNVCRVCFRSLISKRFTPFSTFTPLFTLPYKSICFQLHGQHIEIVKWIPMSTIYIHTREETLIFTTSIVCYFKKNEYQLVVSWIFEKLSTLCIKH